MSKSIRISDELNEKLRVIAENNHRSINSTAIVAIEEFVEKHEAQNEKD